MKQDNMPKTWVTHLPHFLDKSGSLPTDMPASARHLAETICSFVMYATNFGFYEDQLPHCFVKVKNKNCSGRVMPLLAQEGDVILWQCEECKNTGIISGWQGTLWDMTEY